MSPRVDFSIHLAALIAALASGSDALAQVQTCPVLESRAATLSDIDDRLEITLEDGARLRLFGVESPHPSDGGRATVDLRAALTDRDLSVDFVTGALDRWGRRAARVVAAPTDGTDAISVAEWLIGSGRARVRVEPGAASCMTDLLRLEASARARHAGLWANIDNAPLRAGDRDAFAGHAGQNVVVEGRIFSVGETSSRLYLNFGPVRTVDFAATVPKTALKTLASGGIDARQLTGAWARARGMLDMRFGPQIEIVDPGALEIVAPAGVSPYNSPLVRK